jgi:hypothetical protein
LGFVGRKNSSGAKVNVHTLWSEIETLLFKAENFITQNERINNNSRSNCNLTLRMKNARRQKVGYNLASTHPYGVTRVVATLNTTHKVGILCKQINELAFAFITKLSTKNTGGFAGHEH